MVNICLSVFDRVAALVRLRTIGLHMFLVQFVIMLVWSLRESESTVLARESCAWHSPVQRIIDLWVASSNLSSETSGEVAINIDYWHLVNELVGARLMRFGASFEVLIWQLPSILLKFIHSVDSRWRSGSALYCCTVMHSE